MVPMDHNDSFDLSLESILDEYRGFDPEAPEQTPMPEAAFASKVAEAELIGEAPDELLTPEALVELEPEEAAEPEEPDEPEEPEDPEDAFAATDDEIDPGNLDDILAELLSEREEPLPQASEPEPEPQAEADEDEDVRAYYPHGQAPMPETFPEEAIFPTGEEPPESEEPGAAAKALGRLKALAMRFVDAVAPVEPEEPSPRAEEPAPEAEEAYESEPEDAPEAPESAPLSDEEPTQVFQAVANTFGREDRSPELPEDEAFWAQVLEEEKAFYAQARAEREGEPEDTIRPDAEPYGSDEEADEYGEYDEYEEYDEEDEDEDEYEDAERRSFHDAVIVPIQQRLSAVSLRLRDSREARREREAMEEDPGPEPSARQAQRHYVSREGALRTRSRMAAAVTLVLLYLTSGLPVLGLLKNSPRVMAMMCVLLLLVVMLIGLDVLTVGLVNIKRRRPGIESLVLLGCLFSLLDGGLCAFLNTLSNGMPYCAVSAIAVTGLIHSAFCLARGQGATFFALRKSQNPDVYTAGTNEVLNSITLSKTRRSTEGFVHRTEEPGPDAVAFAVLTPYLIAVGVVLSLLATVLSGSIRNAGHIFAGVFSTMTPLVAILVWSSPFRRLATFLQPKGLAIAGWSGACDIGRSKYFTVLDRDLFSPTLIKLDSLSFTSDDADARARALIYTWAVLNAAECGLAPVFQSSKEFREAAADYPSPNLRVEDLKFQSPSGIEAYVDGEQVLLGTPEFLRTKNLLKTQIESDEMGILYVAINQEICAQYHLVYHAQRNTESALHYLLRSREKPVFATRDPNIDPRTLKRIFHTQSDHFRFPSYPMRETLSDPYLGEEDSICGIITRQGLAPLLTITKTGRQLCVHVRRILIAALFLLGFSLLMMFWMSCKGDFATCSAFHLALCHLASGLIPPFVNHFIRR